MIVCLNIDATVCARVHIRDEEAEDLALEEMIDKAFEKVRDYYSGDEFVRLDHVAYSEINPNEDHPDWDYDFEVQGGGSE